MHLQLRTCSKCKKYSLKESCDTCKEKTVSVHPAKFYPDDKYMRYRILNKNN